MHNPSFQTARNARKDVVLPGGYFIPRGSVVIPCFPSMHNNPAHWDNPLRFEPERWSEDGIAGRLARQGLYTPFAAGGRGCVGMNLALMEVKMVLIELVYRYHFADASPETVIYDPEFLVTRPINFYAAATKRSEWPECSGTSFCQGVCQSLKVLRLVRRKLSPVKLGSMSLGHSVITALISRRQDEQMWCALVAVGGWTRWCALTHA